MILFYIYFVPCKQPLFWLADKKKKNHCFGYWYALL